MNEKEIFNHLLAMSLKISADRRIKARKRRKMKQKSSVKFSMDRILNSFPIFQCKMCLGRYQFKSDYYNHDCPNYEKWEEYQKIVSTQGVESEVPIFKIPKLPKRVEDKKSRILEKLKVDAERMKIEAEKAKIEEDKAEIEAEKARMKAQKLKIEAAIEKSTSYMNSLPKIVIYPKNTCRRGKKNYANLIKKYTEIENETKALIETPSPAPTPQIVPIPTSIISTVSPNGISPYTRLFELLTDGIKRKRCAALEDKTTENSEKPKISFSIERILGLDSKINNG